MRKAFNFYRSYWDVANELNDKERLEFYDALLKREFTGEESELSGMVKFAYLSQKHSIDNQIFGYVSQMNKKHPNQDPWQGGTKEGKITPRVQEKEKVKEKVEVKVELENIEDRKQKFADNLKPFVEKYGREFIKDFYLYWSETTLNNKKMKYELEKTWSLERRLYKWESNAKKFGTVLPIEEKTKFKAAWQ
jgi:hypothetical protein